MSTFANRVALITGAASGIGKQLALLLAAEGAAVGAVDRNAAALDELAAAFAGKRFCSVVADVTDPEQMRKAAAQVAERCGPVDLLIASAGVGMETSAHNLSAVEFAAVINVNLLGVVNSIAAVLPGMIERRAGHVVALSSLASFRGMPRMAAYCASKSGVNAVMESLRGELHGQGIAFTTICPGWIRTPMTADLDLIIPDMLEVEYAARCILEAVRRRKTFFAFPPRMTRQLRVLRWLPFGMSDWLVARMMAKMNRAQERRDDRQGTGQGNADSGAEGRTV